MLETSCKPDAARCSLADLVCFYLLPEGETPMLKMKCSIFIVIATVWCSSSAFSQATPNKQRRTPKFSSAYTDMQRDCKSAVTKQEEREMEARGQDIPQSCKGYGDYYPNISDSALVSYVWIASKRDAEFSLSINSGGVNRTGRKLEWRLADGRPFAVILRVAYYSGEYGAGESPYDDKYKTKETLVVKGLKGYEKIGFELDVKTPNANEKARQMVDQAFLEGR
jgi:hypothetical protein